MLFFYGIGATSAQMDNYMRTNRFPEGTRWHCVKFNEELRSNGFFGYLARWIVWLLAHLPIQWLGFPRFNPPASARMIPALWNANVAGIGDQEAIAKMVHHHAQNTTRPYVLYGVSRGALALFRALRLMNPAKKPALVILEGCPDTIANVALARYGSIVASSLLFLGKWATHYSIADDLAPEQVALPEWLADVPVAVVASTADTHVPAQNTMRVIEHLRRSKRNVPVMRLFVDVLTHNELSGVTERLQMARPELEKYREFVRQQLEEHVSGKMRG